MTRSDRKVYHETEFIPFGPESRRALLPQRPG
jgi:hypothetical protein